MTPPVQPPLTPSPSPLLPPVIQLGFAGSRLLFDPQTHPHIDPRHFESQIENHLTLRLTQLPLDLRLPAHSSFSGISALAIGADFLFAHACQALKIPHRIILPQTRDEFLNAHDDDPDFPHDSQKLEAARLLDSPHVIQDCLISDSADRIQRFRNLNREIIRASHLLLCLLRVHSIGKPGGTEEFLALALHHQKPTLVIQVDIANNAPAFTETWHGPKTLPETNAPQHPPV